MNNTARAIISCDSARMIAAYIQTIDVSLLPGSAEMDTWLEKNMAEQMAVIRKHTLAATVGIDAFIRVPLPFSLNKRPRTPVFKSAFRVGEMTAGAGCLVVSDISRLGMNRPEIVYTVQETILKKHIKLILCDPDICIAPGETKGSASIKLFTALENVEETLNARRESLERVIRKGSSRPCGRPTGSFSSSLDRKRKEIEHYLALEYTREKISRILGVKRSALDYFIRTRNIAGVPSGKLSLT